MNYINLHPSQHNPCFESDKGKAYSTKTNMHHKYIWPPNSFKTQTQYSYSTALLCGAQTTIQKYHKFIQPESRVKKNPCGIHI